MGKLNWLRMTGKELLEQCARKVVPRWFYAAVQDDKKSFVVRTLLNEEHTCDLDFSITKLKSEWLAKRYIHLFGANPH